MSIKLAPLLTPDDAHRIARLACLERPSVLSPLGTGVVMPPPARLRSPNGIPKISLADFPKPQLMRSTNTPIRSPADLPPVLIRPNERFQLARDEIEPKKLW